MTSALGRLTPPQRLQLLAPVFYKAPGTRHPKLLGLKLPPGKLKVPAKIYWDKGRCYSPNVSCYQCPVRTRMASSALWQSCCTSFAIIHLENCIAGLLILILVCFIMSWLRFTILVLICLRESCRTVPCCSQLVSPSLCTAPCCFASVLHLLRLQNMSAQPSQCSGRSCSSPHPLSLARHPLGRHRHSSHPVDLLPIHPCGRCRRSSHPSG